jgi:hypothetical protein
MNSDNITRVAHDLSRLLDEMLYEIRKTELLAKSLEDRIRELELKAEVLSLADRKGYNMTDLGNMVDEISKEGLLDDYINERISDHPDVASEDSIREWARDEAQEVLSNASFEITVN